ncbi:unnamed protein product, partial [Amoebophrya sp. A25]
TASVSPYPRPLRSTDYNFLRGGDSSCIREEQFLHGGTTASSKETTTSSPTSSSCSPTAKSNLATQANILSKS